MLVLPPGLLTTLTLALTSLLATRIRSSVRAVRSTPPPGAKPTTISTFRCGDQPGGEPISATHKSTDAISALSIFMPSLPCAGVRTCAAGLLLDQTHVDERRARFHVVLFELFPEFGAGPEVIQPVVFLEIRFPLGRIGGL